MEGSVKLLAPAKLNLTLEVLNRRSDGFHNLRSVMVPVALYDEIEIRRSPEGFGFSCDRPELTAGNLVLSALDAVASSKVPYSVALRKGIPAGGGLGGGSSDAATMLLAAMDGVFGAPPQANYLEVARALGSDVPFFLARTAAIVEGTGERVTPLGAAPPWHATIVRPPVAVATAEAYEALDGAEHKSRPRNTSLTLQLGEALQRAQFDRVIELMCNDFEGVIVPKHPQVRDALELLSAWSGRRAMLTGSGSCVFTLWQHEPPSDTLALPPGFERYDAAFVHDRSWRAER